MSKQATNKKTKPKQCPSPEIVNDIIKQVKDTHKKVDKKLAELAKMCTSKETEN